MANAKDNLLVLTTLNFKEEKSKSDPETKPVQVTGSVNKYDSIIFCRTCANADPCLVPIFKEEGLDYSLSKKIEKYLPIKVSEEDDLPLHLCYHCASTLIAWDTLVIGCVEAEKKLTFMKHSFENKKHEQVSKNINEAIQKNIDSDDEPLITKKKITGLKKNEDKRDILQEKNDLQTLEPVEIETERRSVHSEVRKWDDEKETHDENIKKQKKCWKCGKNFWHSLKKHMKTYHCKEKKASQVPENVPHRCPICQKVYVDVKLFCKDLYSHLVFDLSDNSDKLAPNVCKVCKTTYEATEQLSRHILLHVDSQKSKENSGSARVRKKNKKERIKEKPSKPTCGICGKTISRKYAMKRHLATHTGEKKFTCHHCGKQYAQESGLQRHVLVIHEGVRKYKCPICSQIFGSNGELKSHQDTHTDPRPFQCDQCGRTFISQKHLYHHRKYHHTANGMRQLCEICNRYFSSPSVLRRHHKVVHLGLKEFQCHVCSAQLSTKHYLQEHLRLHSDERPEVCSFCGKTFQMAGNLRQHMKTHMGKTQICYVCGKGFTRRCHLVIHMSSHRGLEHPRCEHCSQVFVIKTDLEKHLRKMHTPKPADEPNI